MAKRVSGRGTINNASGRCRKGGIWLLKKNAERKNWLGSESILAPTNHCSSWIDCTPALIECDADADNGTIAREEKKKK